MLGDTASTKPVKKNTDEPARVLTFAERVKITPNPSKDELLISVIPVAGDVNEIKSVVIVTGSGAEVYNRKFSGADHVVVNLNDLPSGMFLIKVNGEFAGKVVKN